MVNSLVASNNKLISQSAAYKKEINSNSQANQIEKNINKALINSLVASNNKLMSQISEYNYLKSSSQTEPMDISTNHSNFQSTTLNQTHLQSSNSAIINNIRKNALNRHIPFQRVENPYKNDPFIGFYTSTGINNGRSVYEGPRDGIYYINKCGSIDYVKEDLKITNVIRVN